MNSFAFFNNKNTFSFERIILWFFSILCALFIIRFVLTILFFGCEYCFQIPELDLEIIELRSNLAKKEIYSFKKLTGNSDKGDYIVFNNIDSSREIYFDKENLSTIYFDSFGPGENTLMSNNNYSFVFGRLFQDEVMSCLLQDSMYFKLRKGVSDLYFEFSFGLHCYYHYVEDSAVIQHKEITPVYHKTRYFLTDKQMKTIIGIP